MADTAYSADHNYIQYKICTSCGLDKPISEFHWRSRERKSHHSECKVCLRERVARNTKSRNDRLAASGELEAYKADISRRRRERYHTDPRRKELNRLWALENEDRLRAKRSEYARNNAERLKSYKKKWAEENKERAKAAQERYNSKPKNKISTSIRAGIKGSLRRRGLPRGEWRKWEKIVGYSAEELISHLERQFVDGMTWENHGKKGGWEIDHIIPISSFNFTSTDDPEFRACWALTNLRPLWGTENRKKNNRRLTLL